MAKEVMDNLKKFLIKDFIKYATPCFGCGKPNNFYFGYSDVAEDDELRPLSGQYSVAVNEQYFEIDLQIKYKSQLKILVFHKNNKVITSNVEKLNEFLKHRQLFLWVHCHHCSGEIKSKALTFNFELKTLSGLFINATSISYEFFKIIDRDNTYTIHSNFYEGITRISVYKTPEKDEFILTNDLSFNLPLLPKYEMKNKEYLIKKIRTYILYS